MCPDVPEFLALALARPPRPEPPAGVVAPQGKPEEHDERAAGDGQSNRLESQIKGETDELDGMAERVRQRDLREDRGRVIEAP
jgi:hypothetical protein